MFLMRLEKGGSVMKRRLIAALLAAMMALTIGAPAAFAGVKGDANCNAGRGNNSETTPENDCDPGNSGGVNQGGD
jgi:uncharacterized membrane protein